MTSTATLDLSLELLRQPSVTPIDHTCQNIMADRLAKIGFNIENMRFDDVDNLWARKGTESPVFCFAGHTDVVPTGSLDAWGSDPFQPEIRDGKLYGRGSADMKTALAAMVVASERFVAKHPNHKGSIAFLITSDEEGPSINGTTQVCRVLQERNEQIDYCLVAEPSSDQIFGDTIKNGRRGSLNGALLVKGKQGHVAYPHKVRNPIHQVMQALSDLVAEQWDQGNEFFPPTTFQISNFQAGTGANNVVPGQARVAFNFRYSTASTAQALQERVCAILDKYDVEYELSWDLSGEPFLTPPSALSKALQDAIKEYTGVNAELSTSGGTSDGRFIAKICSQIIEFGPINASIHQIDEHIDIRCLEPLKNIYKRTLEYVLL